MGQLNLTKRVRRTVQQHRFVPQPSVMRASAHVQFHPFSVIERSAQPMQK